MKEATNTVLRLIDFVPGGELCLDEMASVEGIEETFCPGGFWTITSTNEGKGRTHRYFHFASITCIHVKEKRVTVEQGMIQYSFYFKSERLAAAYVAMVHELQIRFLKKLAWSTPAILSTN